MNRSYSPVGSYRIGDKVKIGGALAGTAGAVTGGSSFTVTCVGEATETSLWSDGNSFTVTAVGVSDSVVVAFGWTSSMKETADFFGGGTSCFVSARSTNCFRLALNSFKAVLDDISTNDLHIITIQADAGKSKVLTELFHVTDVCQWMVRRLPLLRSVAVSFEIERANKSERVDCAT